MEIEVSHNPIVIQIIYREHNCIQESSFMYGGVKSPMLQVNIIDFSATDLFHVTADYMGVLTINSVSDRLRFDLLLESFMLYYILPPF